MVTHLLNRETLLALARSRNEEGFREGLKRTPYREIIEALQPDATAIDYEKAFYTIFLKRLDYVIKVASEDFIPFLMAYFPLRFEVVNLKRILRGKYTGQSREEIVGSLLPVSPQGIGDLSPFLDEEDVEKAVALMRGTMYNPLLDRLGDFRELNALWVLELELNHVYFHGVEGTVTKVLSRYKELISSIIEVEESIQNLLLAISLPPGARSVGMSSLSLFIEHSHLIPSEMIEEVIGGGDLSTTLKGLKDPISGIIAPLLNGDSAMVRIKLFRFILNAVFRRSRVDAFDFPYILWYLLKCEAEILDLTRIAWGLDQGLEFEQFSRYFIMF